MVKYIISLEDMLDYMLDELKINTDTKVIDVCLVRKDEALPPIRAVVRFAPVAYNYTVPTVTCWTEATENNVTYMLTAQVITFISTNLTRIIIPILKSKIEKGGTEHVRQLLCHGN
jgi:hypothetical protein